MILVIFGTGAISQVVLSSDSAVTSTPKGDYLSISFGFAVGKDSNSVTLRKMLLIPTLFSSVLFLVGAGLGVWISGGISGGHINPAVRLSFRFQNLGC